MCRKGRLRLPRKPSPPFNHQNLLFSGMEKKARPSADVTRQTWRRFSPKQFVLFLLLPLKWTLITFCISGFIQHFIYMRWHKSLSDWWCTDIWNKPLVICIISKCWQWNQNHPVILQRTLILSFLQVSCS